MVAERREGTRLTELVAARAYNEFLEKSNEKESRVLMSPLVQRLVLTVSELVAREIYHEQKTELLNTLGIEAEVTQAITQLSEPENGDDETWAVLFIDVNWFKQFNDRLRHKVGDQYLIGLADVFRQVVRNEKGDWVARIGGDEFLMIIRAKESSKISIEQIMESQDPDNPGVLLRLESTMQEFLASMAQKNPQFNTPLAEYNGRSLLAMGVASLAVGMEYLSSAQLVERYQRWMIGTREEYFINNQLIEVPEFLAKSVAKLKVRDVEVNQAVWVAN